MKCTECSMFVPFPNNPEKGVCGETLQNLIDDNKINVITHEKDGCITQFAIPQEGGGEE